MEKSKSKNKTTLRRGFKAEAERISLEFRSALGLEPHEFMCAFKLCEYLNIPVLKPSDFSLQNLNDLQNDSWSAIRIAVDQANIIIHNPNNSSYRQQSDIMHEVAHVVCKHEHPLDEEKAKYLYLLRVLNPEQEAEANWLGGTLQLPEKALIWAWRKFKNEKAISEYYSASEVMVNYRLGVTGVKIREKRYSNMFLNR